MKTILRTLVAILLLALVPRTNAQQQFATLQKGFQADKLYQFGNLDHINIFNGNLIVALPIGLQYPANGGLTYQLQLSYNSKAWDFESVPALGVVRARPTKRSNAGFGWLMGLGRFIPFDDYVRNSTQKNIWEAPDGADHVFDDGDRTTDGSNLRLRTVGIDKEIDFPDGTIHRFVRVSGTNWELREIRAARPLFGPDTVTIDSLASASQCPFGTASVWRISDSRTRAHYVCFRNYDVDGEQWPMVERIVLDAPQGATANYTFTYTPSQTIDKPSGDTDWDGNRWRQTHVVPLLSSLTLPDGSQFDFTYGNNVGNLSSAPLRSVTLPTRGKIEYTYQEYLIPSLDLCATTYGDFGYGFAAKSDGILTRTFRPAVPSGQTSVPEVWTYTPDVYDLGPNASDYVSVMNCTPPTPGDPNAAAHHPYVHDELVVKVTDPAGHVVANHFSVWPGRDVGRLPDQDTSPVGFKRRYYGYPYGPYDASQNRFLSQQFFPCATCAVSRSIYVRHDAHPTGLHPDGDPEAPHTPASQRTVFHDDPNGSYPHYIETDSTDWDGYGHYRTVTTSGSFGLYPNRKQTVTTTWNKVNGVPRTISTGDKWLPNTYESITTSEGDAGTFVEQACFDTTGFLQARRHLSGTSPSSSDLLSIMELGSDGNPEREKYYGGDTTPLPAGANQPYLCSALSSLSGVTAAYQMTHTWQNGEMATSQHVGMPFLSMDLTIDRSGMITKARDTAGLETNYTYDSSGRLTAITPPGTTPTSITYDVAAASGTLLTAPAKATQSTGTGNQEVKTIYEFDSFGRVVLQKQRMPSDPSSPQTEKWSARRTTYDILGQKATESELEDFTGGTFVPQHVTTYSNYDAFGRAGTVTAPDNSTVTFTYFGTREIRRQTTGGGTVPLAITNREFYDPFGRLHEVRENSSPNGELTWAYYSHDAANRLTAVRMLESGGLAQSRYFNHDGRGLLRWESQPETGMKSYTYDARGHMRSVELGAAKTMFDLKYTYDTGERLQKVEARSPSNPDTYRVFKEFEYGTTNDFTTPDYRLGKLVTATRYNYKPEPTGNYPWSTVRVTEAYAYKDAAGHKTHRTTTIANDANNMGDWRVARSITQSLSYDSMGNPSVVSYPMCENCGAPSDVPWQNITSTYANGRIASVSNFVSSISYWPNGMRRVLHHTNGMEDTQTPDPSGIARPGSLKSEIYKPCAAPVITSQTLGAVRNTSQSSVQLEVSATGSAPLTYRWYDATIQGSPVLIGSGAPYLDVAPTSTKQYYAEVENECRITKSKTITVKYGNCVDPWITGATAVRNANGTFTLSVTASGTATLTYSWIRTSDSTVIGTSSAVTTGVLSTSTDFTIVVSNACGGSSAVQHVMATVPVSVTTFGLMAIQFATNRIDVGWEAVPGATTYEVYRRADTQWVYVTNTPVNSYTDLDVLPDKAYAYYVIAYQNSTKVGQSNADVATTVAFTPVAGTWVSSAPFYELLQGVNAVRALSGWTAVTWSNILSPSDPLPDPGNVVLARHLLAIRARLGEAMQAVGAPIGAPYTDSDLQEALIRAIHITELQIRLK